MRLASALDRWGSCRSSPLGWARAIALAITGNTAAGRCAREAFDGLGIATHSCTLQGVQHLFWSAWWGSSAYALRGSVSNFRPQSRTQICSIIPRLLLLTAEVGEGWGKLGKGGANEDA